MRFLQINTKKAQIAAIELNKKLVENDDFVCLITEPHRSKGRLALIPSGVGSIAGSKRETRAAILFGKNVQVLEMTSLSNRDCAVGLLKSDSQKILLASVYLDINTEVSPTWLLELVGFAKRKSYPLVIGMDSNAHSTLFGPDMNARGEELEDFIVNEGLNVENIGQEPTYRVVRGERHIGTCIDVTLTFGLPDAISGWHTDQSFNGSDHATIIFDLEFPKPVCSKSRKWDKGDWKNFKHLMESQNFYFPAKITNKKLDKMVSSLYKAINNSLEVSCPLEEIPNTIKNFTWYKRNTKI